MGTVVVVIVAIVLGGLADDCANASTRRSTDQSSLEAAAEDRTKRGATGPANKRAFAGANTALLGLLVVVVIVMVGTIVVVVVVATLRAVPHAVVVGTIVMARLRKRGANADSEEKRGNEDRFSKRAHLKLDAGFHDDGLLPLQVHCFAHNRKMPEPKPGHLRKLITSH